MGFRMVLKSATLNDLDSVMAVSLCYFTKFSRFGANNVAVVEVKPTLSATRTQTRESSFWQYMTYSAILRHY